MQTESSLASIREELDKKVSSNDIQEVESNLIALQSLSGLCAEVVKNTEQDFLRKQGELMEQLSSQYSAKVLEGIIQGKLSSEYTLHKYAKSLLESLKYKADALRTTISLYKTELETNLRQSNNQKNNDSKNQNR